MRPLSRVGVWLPCRCLPRALRHASAHHLVNHTRCARCAPDGAVSRQRDTWVRPPSERAWAHSSRRQAPRCDPPPAKGVRGSEVLQRDMPTATLMGNSPRIRYAQFGGSDAAPPPSVARFVPATVPGGTRSQGPKARECIVRVQLYAAPRRMHRTGRRVIERERTGSGSSVGGGRAHGVDPCARRFAVEFARALVP